MAINLKKFIVQHCLPPTYTANDTEGLWSSFFEVFSQVGGQEFVDTIQNIDSICDIDTCPESFLSWLAAWCNFPLEDFARVFGWSQAQKRQILAFVFVKQRFIGTRKAIKEFVETFIPNAVVLDIFEPWQDLFKLSEHSQWSGEGHIANHLYWRDCTVHITIADGGEQVRYLLEWLIDPRVKVYLTQANSLLNTISIPIAIKMCDIMLTNHTFNTNEAFIVSQSELSNLDQLSGKLSYWLFQDIGMDTKTSIEQGPLANSIWTVDELSMGTIVTSNPVIVSGETSDSLSDEHTLGGDMYILYDSPVVGDNWHYIPKPYREV